ncbi:hypothetical protein EC988_005419, partial [Linderina pennispora]
MFGSSNTSSCHGVFLTAWSIASVGGGLTFTGIVNYYLSEGYKPYDIRPYNVNFAWMMALVIAGFICCLFVRSSIRDRLFPALPNQILRIRIFGRVLRVLWVRGNHVDDTASIADSVSMNRTVQSTIPLRHGWRRKRLHIELLSKEQEKVAWEEYLFLRAVQYQLLKEPDNKKLILQGLKAIPALPVTFKDETWVRLQNAIRAIQASKPTAQGFEELYRDCENMCLHKLGSELYANLQGECLLYARTQLSEINKGQDETENGTVLTATRQFWTQYTQQLAVIRCVFLYLDRTYVLQTANTPSLWAMGLAVVRQCLEDSGMAVRLARLIVQEIARERDGATVDCAMLRVLTQMLVDLNLYSQYL